MNLEWKLYYAAQCIAFCVDFTRGHFCEIFSCVDYLFSDGKACEEKTSKIITFFLIPPQKKNCPSPHAVTFSFWMKTSNIGIEFLM